MWRLKRSRETRDIFTLFCYIFLANFHLISLINWMKCQKGKNQKIRKRRKTTQFVAPKYNFTELILSRTSEVLVLRLLLFFSKNIL